MLIPRKQRLIRQPANFPKLADSRITHCIPFNGENREIVKGTPLIYGAAGSVAIDSRGKSLKSAGGAAGASVAINLSSYSALTFSFWMYWDAYTNNDDLAFEYGTNFAVDNGFLIDPSSGPGFSGYFQYATGKTGAASYAAINRPSAAAWHHYMFVFDRYDATASGLSVYVDGVLQSSVAGFNYVALNNNFGNSGLYIFSRNNASLFGAGKLQNLVIRGGYKANAADARQEFSNPWGIFKARNKALFVPLGPGVQTLTQSSRFDNSASFFSPTVTRGTVTLNQSARFDNASVFYAPTVSLGGATQTLSPGLFTNANTFYAPVVSVGPVTLTQLARFDNGNSIYSPIVTLAGGPQYVVQSVIFNNSTVFYSATVTQTGGSQSLTQSSRFDNANSFYSPSVSNGGVTLSPTDIAAIADAVWAKAIEGFKADEMMRIMFAALAGKREGLGTSVEQYMAVDGVTPRITFTPDANGNGTPTTDGAP